MIGGIGCMADAEIVLRWIFILSNSVAPCNFSRRRNKHSLCVTQQPRGVTVALQILILSV